MFTSVFRTAALSLLSAAVVAGSISTSPVCAGEGVEGITWTVEDETRKSESAAR